AARRQRWQVEETGGAEGLALEPSCEVGPALAAGAPMLDVLVTCVAYSKRPAQFPQVRGYYLSQHLRRLGLRAGFRPLPLGPTRCEVLIWSDYQSPFERFERRLAGALSEVRADRLFCMLDYSLGERDHFSRAYSEWFAARGGVLCQGLESPLAPYEHWIGVGVDTD